MILPYFYYLCMAKSSIKNNPPEKKIGRARFSENKPEQ